LRQQKEYILSNVMNTTAATNTLSLVHVLTETFSVNKTSPLGVSVFLKLLSFSWLVQATFYLLTGFLVQSFSRNPRPLPVLANILLRNARNLVVKCLLLYFAYVVIERRDYDFQKVTFDWRGFQRFALIGISTLLLHDTTFFFSHYALHSKLLFKRFHALHHTVYEPTGIDCYYESVVDHLCNDLFVAYIPLIFDVEFWVIFLFCTIETIASVVAHSGLDMDFIQYHDIHHRRERYNYAALFPWWDMLFGTYKNPSTCKRKEYRKKKE
jgi:sterol desaturase/sphingolipid hydroxylase (fatty acid hydroxylase superfamily)